jgi:hypothetical protein
MDGITQNTYPNGSGRGPYKGHKKTAFLKAFSKSGTISCAARMVGLERKTIYNWLETDQDFFDSFHHAEEEITETLEELAFKKAVEGSDRMIVFLLQSRRPEKYRNQPLNMGLYGRPGNNIYSKSPDQRDLEKMSSKELIDILNKCDNR